MKRFPWIASVIVALAVAAMIALGVWQLGRADEKAALLERYGKADAMAVMAYPTIPMGEELWFRRAVGFCLEPVSTMVEPGRNRKGQSGWRHIMSCRTGAEGPGIVVDTGWSRDFKTKVMWRGGEVFGIIAPQPDHRSVISKTVGNAPAPGLMLVSATPADDLEPSAPPSLKDVPNNHFSYAIQWFIFAGIAALIYGLALRQGRAHLLR